MFFYGSAVEFFDSLFHLFLFDLETYDSAIELYLHLTIIEKVLILPFWVFSY